MFTDMATVLKPRVSGWPSVLSLHPIVREVPWHRCDHMREPALRADQEDSVRETTLPALEPNAPFMRLSASVRGIGLAFEFMIMASPFGTLTKFFEPTRDWLDWMKENFGDRMIVDCGTGIGHVVRALKKRGMKAIGIDLYPSEAIVNEHTGFYLGDASCFPYSHDWVPIFCRPCHDGFVMESIEHAFERGCGDVLYISKRINYERDIDEDLLHEWGLAISEVELENIGEEEEVMWRVRKKS
jgi:hypothetical protein